MTKKRISHCQKCGEPTTHRYDVDKASGTEEWVCSCCESSKYRTPEQIKEIKKTRKGWANNGI